MDRRVVRALFCGLLSAPISSFVIDGPGSAPAAGGTLTGIRLLPPNQTHIVFLLLGCNASDPGISESFTAPVETICAGGGSCIG
eukprot:255999-Prymnesium_polylepis.1